MKRFRDMGLNSKMIVMSLVSSILVVLYLVLYLLPSIETKLLETKKEGLRQLIEVASSRLADHDRRVKAGDLSLEQAQKLAASEIKKARYNKDDYFWINDLNATIIMHPTKPEMDGKNQLGYKDTKGKLIFKEFVEICKKKGEGPIAYSWPRPGQKESVRKMSYVKAFAPWGWIVGTGIYIDDIDRDIARLRWTMILGLLVLALATFGITMPIGLGIVRPIRNVSKTVMALSQGNLSIRAETTDSKDEVGILSKNVNIMIESFNRAIRQVSESARSMLSSIQTLQTSAQRTGEEAADQASHATQISVATDEMAQTINELAKGATFAADISYQAMNVAQRGEAASEVAVKTMSAMAVSARGLGQMIEQLSHSVSDIGDVVVVINDIADQTNLLALNAAIEAARAGEQGRGFAVVADEVKKLAERTMRATAEISQKIMTVSDDSGRAKKSMEEEFQKVLMAVENMQNVEKSLNEIVAAAQKTRDEIAQMAMAIEGQSTASTQVSSGVENTARAAKTIDQMAGQVLHEVRALTTVASDLNASIECFKVEA